MTTTLASLPKIVAILSTTDAGEFGAATCPHCGADGRYVKTFKCDDGTTRGAMAGCIRLFPISPLAEEHSKIQDKVRKGTKLNGWDTKKLAAIEAVLAGSSTEAEAIEVVRAQNFSRNAWMAQKFGGRR